MTETDAFNFSKLKVFENIKDNLPEEAREISDVYEDLLFVWNYKESNLLVVNWRSAQSNDGKDVKHQALLPSSTPNFAVSKILVSFGGTYVAISSNQGVSIIETPCRWGRDGLYHDGKSKITCTALNIQEHTSNQLDVLQIRWHPNSPSDSHLLMLLSDNSIRIFDEGILKHTWRVGPLPTRTRTDNNFSFNFGDRAIDFDIAPPQITGESPNNTAFMDSINSSMRNLSIVRKQERKKVEWPIVVLRANGSIYVLCAGLNTEKPRLQGPLTMIPSQKDNYGDDSCSLLVIPTLPVTIVIAENSGILHHALMLETNLDDCSLNDTKTIIQNDWTLHVLENIELELGLQEDNKKAESSACPIYLKRDLLNKQRYFCYHETGLHGITVGFVYQLQKYVEHDTENDFILNIDSRAEYIISTKAFDSSKTNPVVGFGMLHLPSGIYAIMSSGQIVSLSAVKSIFPPVVDLSSMQATVEQKTIDQQSVKIPFDQHIKTMLKSDVSQPILELDKTKPPTAQQSFQLLLNSIQIMREKQFVRHDKVRQEIIKRMKILELMKNQQKDEIKVLLKSKEQIQERACKLADMYEDIIEKQQNLQKRIQDVSRLAALKLPLGTPNEKEFFDQIKQIKIKVDKLLQDNKQIVAKNEAQRKALENWNKSSESMTRSTLPPKQEETIKQFLSDMMAQIQNLKSDVQKMYSAVDY